MELRFFIKGEPKPQARPRIFTRGGFAKAYSPKTNWYMIVYYECLAQRKKLKEPFKRAVRLWLNFFLPRPKALQKKSKQNIVYVETKPDLDNLAKAVMDAINNAGLWTDDKLVCELIVTKIYTPLIIGAAGCMVSISDLIEGRNWVSKEDL